MALEGTKALDEPELQLALGGIYAKSDPEKAIATLQHGLSLYQEGDKVNSRIFTSLSTLYMGQKQYGDRAGWLRCAGCRNCRAAQAWQLPALMQ